MSTENVTVLFTDMVGSTELSSSLSAETADEVRRAHFSILRQAVAGAGGTEVKSLGDGVMVVFGSASAALSCAVAMQQGVERDNRDRERAVGLRVGLSGGEVSREDDDYFGDPVIEAARLCARSESGQALAADIVRLMAGRRSRHVSRSLGELTLKGLPDPVETVELLWEPVGTTDSGVSIPLPGRLTVRPGVGVVGREAEMATIADAFKRVAAGTGREVLLVSGEAGLGKTTLVAEAARAAFENGACVLFGHCEEDLATPYQLFAEALGHYVTHATEEQLAAHVAAQGSELARLVPALARRIPDLPPSKASDPETERYLLFAAVVGLLGMASEMQPVVVVLDDLQWADKASLLLLRHLTAADHAMRVLVLGTYRDSELSQSHPLLDTLAALRRQSGLNRIELAGLDDQAVMSFLEAAAGHALDDAGVGLAHAVYRETDGNPFFVNEVLRHLTETGAIHQDATGRWRADGSLEQMALPDSVREVIGARVGRLGPDAGRVLSAASVIGRDFDLNLLARATNTTEDELLDILDAAAAASLVRELADTGRYSFAHALIQHTLYEDLGPNRRARAHQQVAEALEDLCGDRPGARVGELARHWAAATAPVQAAKAVEYGRLAGDRALDALAPDEAIGWYAQALELLGTDPGDETTRCDLLIGLGTAQRQVGDATYRQTLLDVAALARRTGDTDRLVGAALANHRGWQASPGEVDTERVEVLTAALDTLDAPDVMTRARLLATLAVELTNSGDLERITALADEAVALARQLDDPATLVHALNSRNVALRLPETLAERLESTLEAIVLAGGLGDPWQQFLAHDRRQQAAFEAGDRETFDSSGAVLHEIATRVHQPLFRWADTQNRATQALLDGDLDRAEILADEAFAIGTESGQPDALLIYGVQLLNVRVHQGRTSELVDLIAEGVTNSPGLPALRAALARAYRDADRDDEARLLLEASAAARFEDFPRDDLWLIATSLWGQLAAGLRATEMAPLLYERLTPWAGQIPTAVVAVAEPIDHCLGELAALLGRIDAAREHFSAAEATARDFGAPFFIARTLVERARLDAGQDPDVARAGATEALTIATEHGYARVDRDARALLARIG